MIFVCAYAQPGPASLRMDVRICVVFLVFGATCALTGKGFYCRDPDTGKLFPVNTTWKSTTFCGNYTCRLKRKDIPTIPIREFKIAETGTYSADNKSTDIKDSGQENRIADILSTVDPKDYNDDKNLTDIINKLLLNITDPDDKRKINDIQNNLNRTDRYLNDQEIKIIAELLHTVKTSDLETVVDIYNIAQDIYKELDKKTTDPIIDDVIVPQAIQREHDPLPKPLPNLHNHMSYGYDPLQISQKTLTEIKNEESEILTDAMYPKIEHNELTYGYETGNYHTQEKKSEKVADMQKEGSEAVPQVHLTPKFDEPAPTFISPMLSSPGFVKLPYYYQITDFQRQATYVNPNVQSIPNHSITEKTILQAVTEKPATTTISKPAQKVFNPHKPILLPYPYYQVRYNASGYPFNYFYGVNPYQDTYRKQYNPYYVTRTSYVEQIKPPPERSFVAGALVDSLLPKEDAKVSKDTKTSKTPDWKTESLSDDVLDEIRAHFENKNILFKPICLKKKIKLEKVGKVFKLDDFNSREKRSATVEPDDKTTKDVLPVDKADNSYEVYVERTM